MKLGLFSSYSFCLLEGGRGLPVLLTSFAISANFARRLQFSRDEILYSALHHQWFLVCYFELLEVPGTFGSPDR